MKKQNAVGYVRLSRDDDKKNYASIEHQKEMITKYAFNNNFVITEWFEDDNISGYKFDRPAFTKMLDGLEDNTIDIVIEKDLSRIGRSLSKMIIVDNLAENFQLQPENGIMIKTWIGDPEDTALFELGPLLSGI